MYVTSRLAKYEKAYELIEQQKRKEVLQQAEILWVLELYFEMHELLEPEWQEAKGDRRLALQGLIRAAGMMVHAENNNMKAAAAMGAKSLSALLQYGGELTGFIGLDAILAEIKQKLGAAQISSRGH